MREIGKSRFSPWGIEVSIFCLQYGFTQKQLAEEAGVSYDVRHGGMGTFVEIFEICLEAAAGGVITEAILASAKRYKLLF